MKKTLAQLKRDAKNGNLVLEMVERFGKTGEDIPPRLRGPRPLVDSNSVAIMFMEQSASIVFRALPWWIMKMISSRCTATDTAL